MSSSMFGLVLFTFLVLTPAFGNACCDNGWHLFPRPQGCWCVKVFSASVAPTFDQAIQTCYANGATMSGIQNVGEFNYLAKILNTNKGTNPSGGMWVGAKQSDLCLTQSCVNLEKTAFYWYDGHTIGTDGFIWQHGINPSGNGACVRMLYDTWGPQLDDVPCNVTWAALDVVCGKLAS